MNKALPLLLVTLALCTGCQSAMKASDESNEFFGRLWDLMTGHTPVKAAVMMENTEYPDQRREGIEQLAKRKFGRAEPYTLRYLQIAGTDSDWLVRATAIRALNRSRWPEATPVFIDGLSNPNEGVRLEACKALANVPDEKAVPGLLKIVADPGANKDVRIAAADALKNFHTLEVARTLAGQLGGRDFGVAWQSRRSLQMLTGRDLAYDESAWLNYITGPDKPFG